MAKQKKCYVSISLPTQYGHNLSLKGASGTFSTLGQLKMAPENAKVCTGRGRQVRLQQVLHDIKMLSHHNHKVQMHTKCPPVQYCSPSEGTLQQKDPLSKGHVSWLESRTPADPDSDQISAEQ